jgi:flagellar biosynthesis/type III secretory pathway protein FliH
MDSDGAEVTFAKNVSRIVPRLVKAAEFDAQLSAQAIRKRAEMKADQIIKETLERAAKIEEAARYKGEQLGLQRYATAMLELEQARNRFAREAELQLVKSVFSVVKQLLPSLPANVIVEDLALQLIRREGRSRAVQLRVSPAQVEYATTRVAAWSHEGRAGHATIVIEIKADASLDADTCVLKSEFGTVTARLVEQLGALEKNAVAAINVIDGEAVAAASEPTAKTRSRARSKSTDAKDEASHA